MLRRFSLPVASLLLVPVSSLALAPLARADVRVVAPTGAPYTEIQAAVDAANDGDVVLVKTGTYASFVVRNQDVAVVADAGATVQVEGAIRVAGVGATKSVLLSGLVATGALTPSSSTRHGLFARNSTGSIRVVGCQLTGVPLAQGVGQSCYEGQGAYLENCDDVVFVGCMLRGSTAVLAPSGYNNTLLPQAGDADGGHGVYSDTTRLAVYDSTAQGGGAGMNGGYGGTCEPPPFAAAYGYFGASGEGLRAHNSVVFGANSSFQGSSGWDAGCLGPLNCACANAGGNGFVHDQGGTTGFLLACFPTGGAGGTNANTYCPQLTVGWCGGSACSGVPNGPGSAIVGAVSQLGGAAGRLIVERIAREQGTISVAFQGQPGDRVELSITRRTRWLLSLGARGVQITRQGRPQEPVLQVGTLGGSGAINETWTIPDLGPGAQSDVLYLQAVFVDALGQRTLSSPAALVLLDSAF